MISYGRHDINDDDIAAVVGVLRSDWLTTGPAVEAFEEDLQQWTGGVPVVAVSSGTAALHTAYAAAGIGPGDEVITPPITFIATQAAAHFVGATVVFADVEADTANISPEAVEAAITPRTSAIVAVDYAGHPADMPALRAIADRHGLLLIEDAAHSLGSTLSGQPTGSMADITTFSFFPTKNVTTGEGGAVAAKDPAVLARARLFSHQGLIRRSSEQVMPEEGPWHQEVQEFGLNYRIPDILAALGSQQLKRLAEFKLRRHQIKASYDEAFANTPGVTTPTQRPEADPVWHLYPLRVPPGRRRAVFDALLVHGVRAQVNYLPVYRHPVFEVLGHPRPACPVAEDFYQMELSLPMHVHLDDRSIEMVVQTVCRAVVGERE
jgi:dTDP-4-amino-4,6-dideoxygalactose transaminase